MSSYVQGFEKMHLTSVEIWVPLSFFAVISALMFHKHNFLASYATPECTVIVDPRMFTRDGFRVTNSPSFWVRQEMIKNRNVIACNTNVLTEESILRASFHIHTLMHRINSVHHLPSYSSIIWHRCTINELYITRSLVPFKDVSYALTWTMIQYTTGNTETLWQ